MAQKVIVDIVARSRGFAKELQKANSQLEDFGSKTAAVGKDLSTKLTLPIVALGAVSFKAAADLQDAMGAVDQVFKGSSKEVQNWAKNLETYYGISQQEALSLSATMGTLFKNLGGLGEKEAAQQSQKYIQLAGDLASMFGGTAQQASEALSSALKGNYEQMDRYGVSITDARLRQEAQALGVYDGIGALTDQQKQLAFNSLLWKDTADAQGNATRESQQASGQLRAVQTEMKNLSAEIGTKLLPIGVQFLGLISGLVDRFSGLSSGTQNTILVIAGLAAAIGPALYIIGNVLKTVGYLTKAFKLLTNTTKIWAAVTKVAAVVTKVFAAAQAIFNAIMAMNPIVLIVIAIAALVAALVLLYQKNETFREIVQTVWAAIGNFIGAAIEKIKGVLQGAWNFIKTVWSYSPLGMIIDNWSKITNFIGNIMGKAKAIFNTVVATIKKVFSYSPLGMLINNFGKIVEFVKGIPGKVLRALGDLGKTLFNSGKDMIQGLIDGAGSLLKKVGKFMVDKLPGWIKTPFKKAMGIKSPSKVFMQYGQDTVAGLAAGLNNQKPVTTAMRGLSKTVGLGFNPSLKVNRNAISSGNVYQIHLHTLNANAETGRAIVDSIKDFERLNGVR